MVIEWGIMDYENFSLSQKHMQAGMINCESTWLGDFF